jgi:hypothetical protein
VITYGIEAVVGAACLVVAYGVRGRQGLRLLGLLLAVAGVTAIVHASVSLA